MAKLEFDAADVRRVVEHSLAAPAQRGKLIDFDAASGAGVYEEVKRPAVILVHDAGVYLLSNGTPGDALKEGEPNQFAAYAKGCDPNKDPDHYELARELVGGDDFGETLEWAAQIKDGLDHGASKVVIDFSEKEVGLLFEFPAPRRKKRRTAR